MFGRCSFDKSDRRLSVRLNSTEKHVFDDMAKFPRLTRIQTKFLVTKKRKMSFSGVLTSKYFDQKLKRSIQEVQAFIILSQNKKVNL